MNFAFNSMALWPDIRTCVSDNPKMVATSNRFGLERYLLSLNCLSNSRSCWLVNAVRGRLDFPPKIPGCVCAGRRKREKVSYESDSPDSTEIDSNYLNSFSGYVLSEEKRKTADVIN